jgi:transposase-like protein
MRGKFVSPDLMRRVVEEAEAEGNIALVARRYGLSHSTVSRWRQKYLKGELQVEGTPLDSENVRRLLIENRELKRLLGDKELKIQILEDLVKKTAQRSGTKSK